MNSSFDFDRIIDRRGSGAVKWDAVPEDTLPMWVADMDFEAPRVVVDALRRRLDHPVFGYTLTDQDYLNAFAAWQTKRNGWELEPSRIITAPSVMPAVRFAIDALTSPGDRVIVQPPVYFPFYRVVEGTGRRIERNALTEEQDGYRIDTEGLERLCADGAKMLLLCSPHNPVGRVWDEEEIATIAGICAKHDVTVVADEIHADIILPGARFVPFVPAAERAGCRALSLQSPSKTFNIAGLASCTAVTSDEETATAFRRTLRAGNLELPNLLSMVAAAAAYSGGEQWLDELLHYLEGNYRFLSDFVRTEMPQVRTVPLQGTYIAWLDFRGTGLGDDGVAARLRSEAKVRLNEGRQFGEEGRGFQRLNFACPRKLLEEGLSRIAAAFRR
ncbi:MalY/PatB family protein [Salinispira pacifica]